MQEYMGSYHEWRHRTAMWLMHGAAAVQGVYPPGTFGLLGLPGDWYKCLEWQYPPHQRMGAYEEEGRAVNTMKVASFSPD